MWSLAEHQRASGLAVRVAGLRDEYTQADLADYTDIPCHAARAIGPRAFGFSPELRRYVQRYNGAADVVHVHGLWGYVGILARGVSRRNKLPLVISPHGMLDPWALRNSAWKKKSAALLYENGNLRSTVCLHALCESEYQAIRGYGLKNPVCVIPNGVDLPCDTKPRGHPGDSVHLDGDKKRTILFMGRIHPKKGLENLVRAWARLKEDGRLDNKWSLTIAGWDQLGHEDKLKQLADELGLGTHIVFAGPVHGNDKCAVLSRADAFVLPSYSEGLPVAVLEAWSYGLPVIMTRHCNMPEGFDAGAAIEVRPEVESIADGLDRLFSLPKSGCLRMGENGRRLVESGFSWPRAASEMVGTYKWVLGLGERPSCVRVD